MHPLLANYTTRYPQESATIDRFHSLLDTAGNPYDRHHFVPGHITASCWLVDPTGTSVLFTHHRKLNRWLQPGGHCDGDPDVLDAALREADEETGLKDLETVSPEIFDLDIHPIPARKADPEHFHYDVRFAIRATGTLDYTVSGESHDLAWIPLTKLETYTTEPSILRMAQKWHNR